MHSEATVAVCPS